MSTNQSGLPEDPLMAPTGKAEDAAKRLRGRLLSRTMIGRGTAERGRTPT